MSALGHRTNLAAFQIRGRSAAREADRKDLQLSLRATEDGWALLSSSGQVVFWALGLRGRRRCLEFARDAGVLAVLS